jgi:hypothetical protein
LPMRAEELCCTADAAAGSAHRENTIGVGRQAMQKCSFSHPSTVLVGNT